MNGSRRFSRSDVLDVFEGLTDPHEPLATSEVAEALGCARRTAYDRLEDLVGRGLLGTKLVGARSRVWWRPGSVATTGTAGVAAGNGASVDAVDELADVPAALVELTSEEVLELEFRSERLARPFREFVGEDGDVRVDVDGVVELPDGSYVQYWTIDGASAAAIRALPERAPTDVEVRLVSTRGGTHRVEVASEGRSFVATLDEFDGRPVSTVLDRGAVRFVARFPATVDAGGLLSAARDVVADDLDLVSQRLVYTPRLFRSVVEDELTERQWTALRMAHYAGYYAVPRETEGDALAERMGITRQTFSHHRRRAEAVVVANLFDVPTYGGTGRSD
jgi:predicted DNA binding protein